MSLIRPTPLFSAALALGLVLGPTGRGEGIDLREAQARAAERNGDVRAARADLEAALGQARAGVQWPNPTLALSNNKVRFGRSQRADPKGFGLFERNFDQSVALSQLLELGGKRSARRSSGDALAGAARARLEEVERQTRLAVGRAFVAALLTEAQARMLRASAGSLRQEAALAQVRLQAGDISEAERAQVETSAARLELEAGTAALASRQARLQLEALWGEPRPRGLLPLDGDLATLAPTDATRAPGERPDVAAARRVLEKAEADLALERANRVPDVTLQLQYERELPETPHSLGLGISFPLPLPGHRAGELRSARAGVRAAQVALERAQAQAATELAQVQAALAEAKARALRYRAEVLPKAERVRSAAAFSYRQGAVALGELLAAERALNEVRSACLQAEADRALALLALAAARTPVSISASTARSHSR